MHTQVNVEFLTVLFPPCVPFVRCKRCLCVNTSEYYYYFFWSEQPSLFFSSVIFLRKYYTWTNILEPPLQYTCSIFILFPLENWFDGLMNEDHFFEKMNWYSFRILIVRKTIYIRLKKYSGPISIFLHDLWFEIISIGSTLQLVL